MALIYVAIHNNDKSGIFPIEIHDIGDLDMSAPPAVEHAIEQTRVRVLPDGRMDRRNAATYLGLKESTLRVWAVKGIGPRMVRVGSRVFYVKESLDQFIQEGNQT